MGITVVLVLIFTAAPGAHSALPDVDMTAPPEATSALALLSPFLAAQTSTLLILGQVNWTGAFLRGLSSETSRVLLPDERAENDQYLDNFGVGNNCTALVVADEPAEPYSWMERKFRLINGCRYLFWVTTKKDKQLAPPKDLSIALCVKPTGLAVTTRNGSTTLFSVVQQSHIKGSPILLEVDRWSPSDERWEQTGALLRVFGSFCSSWRPPAAGESLTVYEITKDEKTPLPEYFKTLRAKIMDLPWTLNTKSTPLLIDNYLSDIVVESWQKIDHCQLSLIFAEYDALGVNLRKVSVMAEKGTFEISAFVPAGFGPAVNPLDAVLVEFSPAVWLGTALAALCIAAALACTLRRDRGAALLLALAPLLGQAPGTPPPAGRALRPLLGVWLLVCVVLVAAYQGLLLGKLYTARAHTEVNSLLSLKKTGLPIYVTWGSHNVLAKEFYTEPDIKHKLHLATDVSKTLQHVAQHRNCALIAVHDRALQRLLQPLTIPQKKVHSFPIVPDNRRLIAAWTHGSPLGELSHLTYERLDQAGILDHWEDKLDEGNKVALARYLVSLQQVMALTLKMMAPAFYVLFIGLALATLVLGVELATARWCGAQGRTVTPAGQRPRGPALTRLYGRQNVRRRRPAAALRPRARGGPPQDPVAGQRSGDSRLVPDISLVQLQQHRGPRRTAWRGQRPTCQGMPCRV
ncbi:Ionotropic receptor 162 [Frankliniella occidentalis]|nr:Ionotropic receptor 162 [Frankliniella occidentalis]